MDKLMAKKQTAATKKTAKKETSKKSAPKKAATSKKRNNEELATLAEIEAKLLKKAKANGNSLDQSDIYDVLGLYEIDDDVINDLMEYFKNQNVEVISEDAEEDREQCLP